MRHFAPYLHPKLRRLYFLEINYLALKFTFHMQISILQQYVKWLKAASDLIDRIYLACEKKADCTKMCKELVRNYSRSKLDKWHRDLAEEARKNGAPYHYDLNILAVYFQKAEIQELEIGYENFIPLVIKTHNSVDPELLHIYPQLVQSVEQLQSFVVPDLCGDYSALECYVEEVLNPVPLWEANTANFSRFDFQRFRKRLQDTEASDEEMIEFYIRQKEQFLRMEENANQYCLYKKEYDPYFVQLCDVEIEALTQRIHHRQPIHSKIPWLGSATDLAALMERLHEAGYIQAPTKGNGSVNSKVFADLTWSCFSLENLKPESILQALKTKKQSLDNKFGRYLDTLPDRDK